MTPPDLPLAELARIHAACFTTPRPWSEAELAQLIGDSACFLVTSAQGFLLGRTVLDEAEILTIAVDPSARRQGQARALLHDFEGICRAKSVENAFLEVATDNTAARALYRAAGFEVRGRRPRYYRTPEGILKDAEIMGKVIA
ncbi:ribosomal protein S18-alanine N-acetyltransferase [Pseudooceanicola spongiae]|uniref:[Ribosomal protein bS18]-alanine N-acetyltransferase n=1 Tax=Pseudooceanicola spongiae TaxID=2613965 RepID=A0A7L9WMG2_9RHOB|nr:ribosomal protein S18-alanine N-acetyltransferase [Pseudooceanicola spongiae]QOL81585.1 ribosomal-protein-alanine N-acetyltransferase [Pseudooceanicola spongiae]